MPEARDLGPLESALSRRGRALRELILGRFREFIREPEALFWVFVFPILLAVVLGLAFREKAPDKIPIGVIEGPAAERAAAALAAAPQLLPQRYPARAGHEALRTGKISLLVDPGAGTPATPAVFHFDETRPDSRIARLEADDALQRAAGRRDPMPVKVRTVTEPGARYIDFLIPGLLGLNLMGSGVWSIAFSITSARSRKILKRLIATPMHKGDYLLAQILARMAFLLPEVGVLVVFGWLAFGVAIHGSLLLFLLLCVVGTISFCGLGLLVASRVQTIEGANGLANVVLLPMWLLSGTFFSAERYPDAIQPFIRALPLTALNDALRGVMNEGQGFAGVAPELGILVAWGVASFAAALWLFRWK
jgi:ABC-2 type transport system permease protein